VNVEGDPAARAELERLGVPGLPAVAVDGRVVHGWNPAEYARLLGVRYEEREKLPPAELARRLDVVLEAAERLIRALPDAALDVKPPQRDRTIRDLGYHVFRLSLAFIDAMDRNELPESWLHETAPPSIGDAHALAAYGALVRARLAGWFEATPASEYARIVPVYYGPQQAHELLERTTWHAAQHLRQLYDLAARCGVTPPQPMPAAALEGLPLPAALW